MTGASAIHPPIGGDGALHAPSSEETARGSRAAHTGARCVSLEMLLERLRVSFGDVTGELDDRDICTGTARQEFDLLKNQIERVIAAARSVRIS